METGGADMTDVTVVMGIRSQVYIVCSLGTVHRNSLGRYVGIASSDLQGQFRHWLEIVHYLQPRESLNRSTFNTRTMKRKPREALMIVTDLAQICEHTWAADINSLTGRTGKCRRGDSHQAWAPCNHTPDKEAILTPP